MDYLSYLVIRNWSFGFNRTNVVYQKPDEIEHHSASPELAALWIQRLRNDCLTLHVALHDAINSPQGQIPESAKEFMVEKEINSLRKQIQKPKYESVRK